LYLTQADTPREEESLVEGYLAESRALVLEEIRAFMPERSRRGSALYDLMLDYPLREAKTLRPALCIATCRALGGPLEGVLKSAAVLEFYHNAFLIHDDIEDGSEKRRDGPTLHRKHGVPAAINVGDAMLALALEPLLDNMRLLGLGKALRILQSVARMARESAEGQATELSWVKDQRFDLSDGDYLRMVHQKTGWYTFITPMLIGALVAGADATTTARLRRFATALGLAFQIQDDVLNLSADEGAYGKEILGDLWEGKHTLILMHAFRSATKTEQKRARAVLARPRPASDAIETSFTDRVERLAAAGRIDRRVQNELLGPKLARVNPAKTAEDVEFLMSLVRRYASVTYARGVAAARARRARSTLELLTRTWVPSVHLEFLNGIADFVVERER
jgi:geranylgeranyl diphosphate synthase, type II